MKKTLAILVATTALTFAIGLPAWSAMSTETEAEDRPIAAVFDDGHEALPLNLVSADADDNDADDNEPRQRSGHDDDDDDCDDDDDDDDDDNEGCRGALNPAPAGSSAPPQNGLFGSGAAPQVQVK